MKSKKAIVLGGTNAHIALIENLKRRGYYTILVDYYPNPPAKVYADLHLQESTLDKERVLELAKKYFVDIVISTCIDQANVTACFVAEKLGLPAPYSYETALRVTDKVLMKRMMIEGGIPTSRYVTLSKQNDIPNFNLQYPVVVKPADSNGSAGVRKAEKIEDLQKYIGLAFKISRNGFVVLEEYKSGIEISVDCFVKNAFAHVIMLRRKYNVIDSANSVIQCYASVAPAAVSEPVKKKISKIANDIVQKFEISNSSLLIQVIVNSNNDVSVIEFAPRVGGGLSFATVRLNTGFDILDATVDSFFGEQPDLVFTDAKHIYSANNLYAKPCFFGKIVGGSELIKDGIIESIFPYKTKGMRIEKDMASKNRAGAFIVKAETPSELLSKTKFAIDSLQVMDINNSPVMRKNFYIKEI